MNREIKRLVSKYKSLNQLNVEHTFEFDYKNKSFYILDSEVYDKRERAYAYNHGLMLEFSLNWEELEIITAIHNELLKEIKWKL